MKYIILTFLLLVGCGKGPHKIDMPVDCDLKGCAAPEPPPEMPEPYDEKLRPYITEFENDAKLQGVTLNATEGIEFQNGLLEDSENTLGVCYTQGKRRWIRISADWWAKMTDVYKRQLIYHELGHCGLSRPHTDAEFERNSKIYLSIMSTYVTFGNDDEVTEDWPVLVEELFHPEKYAQTKLHDEVLADNCTVTPEGYTACPITYGKAFR